MRGRQGRIPVDSVRLARSATADTIAAFPLRLVGEVARDQAADDRSRHRCRRLGRRIRRVGSHDDQTIRRRRAWPNRSGRLAPPRGVASVDRARLDPHGRDPDGDQPRRSQIRRAGSGHPEVRCSLDHRPDAGIDRHDRTDGRGVRPGRRPGEPAGVLPLRRRAPPLEPRPRGLPDPSRGVLGRRRLARRLATALVEAGERRGGPGSHRRIRGAVQSGSPPRGPRS